MMNNVPPQETNEETQPTTVVLEDPDSKLSHDEQEGTVALGASLDNSPGSNDPANPITALLTELSNELQETNRISRNRESIIDRLHSENQLLKQGELQQALLPIFRDLIRLYDDLKSIAAAAIGDERSARDWNCFKDTVTDILYRYGVEKIAADIGGDFNSKEHKAIGATTVMDQDQDRKISKIVRDGFRTEEKIIRSVEVEVLRYAGGTVEDHDPTRSKEEFDSNAEG